MKSFVALFAAVLCASVVSGAPNWTFEETGAAFGDNTALTCLRTTYAAVSTPESKAFFAKYLPKLTAYFQSEYPKAADAAAKNAVVDNFLAGIANLYFGGIKVSGPSGLSHFHDAFDKVAKDCYNITA